MKALVGAFNQEKALVGAFSVITNLRMELFEALMSRPCPTQQPVSGVWFSLADPHRHPPCCLSDINNSTRNPRENGNRQMDQLWPRRPQWTAGISSVSRLSRYLQNGVDIYTDIYPKPRPASALDPGLHPSVRML